MNKQQNNGEKAHCVNHKLWFVHICSYPNHINELVLCTPPPAAAAAAVSRFLHPLQLLITQSFEKVESFYLPFLNSPGKDESEYVFESKFDPREMVKKWV